MKRVIGIGGIFFQAQDAPALRAWYQRHLGIDVQPWGGTAFVQNAAEGRPDVATIWAVHAQADAPFSPGRASFQVNYRVEDLAALVKVLKAEGCELVGDLDESEFGKFAWVLDPEGNKVELWEPPVTP